MVKTFFIASQKYNHQYPLKMPEVTLPDDIRHLYGVNVLLFQLRL